MSLMDKLRKEAKRVTEERKDFGDKINYCKLEMGDNKVRILPHPEKPDDEEFFKRVHLHYIDVKRTDGTGTYKRPIRCLQDFDEQCPICIQYQKLMKTDKENAGDLRVTERIIYNVFNFAKDVMAPQVLLAPASVHKDIMGWVGEINSNISDLDKGRQWKIVKSKNPKKSGPFAIEYKVYPDMADTSFPTKLRPMLDSMVDLETLFAANEKKVMLEFLGVEEEDADEEVEVEEAPKKALTKEPVVTKAPIKAVVKTKPKIVEEEIEETEIDTEDEELEAELRKLGVE